MYGTVKVLFFSIAFVFLAGCGQNWAPVDDINRANEKLSGIHIVQTGETLYAIGWRYNRDFKELAAANNIEPPYVIYAGQEISLKPATVQAAAPISSTTVSTTAATTPQESKPVVQQQQAVVAPKPASPQPMVMKSGNVQHWQWPVKGSVIANFAQIKGIDIAGVEGQEIQAAADGQVVYAGSGLRGYGQLLIIKHNEQYLSAYAHNSQLIVKEGDWVKIGQAIAKMGSSGTNRVKLHFEIRKDGKPVDPLKYLQ
jgi:lipoprotein NlpD